MKTMTPPVTPFRTSLRHSAGIDPSTESMTFYAIGASSGKIIVGHITLYVSAIGCTDNGYATTLN